MFGSGASKAVPLKRKDTTCTECAKGDAAYKCPTCTKNYCSVDCCNRHKLHCQEEDKMEKASDDTDSQPGCSEGAKRKKEYKFPSEDTIPEEKFLKMRGDERLLSLLKSKKLRNLIKRVNEAPVPEHVLPNCMEDPEFQRFSIAVMDIVIGRQTEQFDVNHNRKIALLEQLYDQIEQLVK